MSVTTRKRKKKIGAPTTYRPEFTGLLLSLLTDEHYTVKDITITHKDGSTVDKTEREAAPPIFLSTIATRLAKIMYPDNPGRQLYVIANYPIIFKRWAEANPTFRNALIRFKSYEIERIRTNASLGLYNAFFSVFTLKNIAGWRDEPVKNPLEQVVNLNITNVLQIIRASENGKTNSPAHKAILRSLGRTTGELEPMAELSAPISIASVRG